MARLVSSNIDMLKGIFVAAMSKPSKSVEE